MHFHSIQDWQHSHDFTTTAEAEAERRTRWVVVLTLVTMIVELIAGWLTGSMALLADGWHMGSHAAALGLSVFAYGFSRRRAHDPRFTFGTGKVPTLAGYTSALLLGAGALWLLVESVDRLLDPVPIRYGEAIAVAVLGLVVNVASAWLLMHGGHAHGHAHGHDHAHGPGHAHGDGGADVHRDFNLRAAYLHIVTDALTSVLAIAALGAGLLWGWAFMDPVMGLVGAALIGNWAWRLARDSAVVLLDAEDQSDMTAKVRRTLEAQPDVEIADLHVWRVGAASRACIVSLVAHEPKPLDDYRDALLRIPGLDHVTVEVHQCRDARCVG